MVASSVFLVQPDKSLVPFAHGSAFRSVISEAADFVVPQRRDASGLVLDVSPLARVEAHRVDAHTRLARAHFGSRAPAGMRADALTSQAGGHARQFEQIHQRILEQTLRPLNLESTVPMNRETPPGPKEHTWRRNLQTGAAAIYRGGTTFGSVSGSYVEESFGIIHLVVAVDLEFFSMQTTNWAGLAQFSRDSRHAVRVLRELTNRIGFNGDLPSRIHGILNYPEMPKVAAAVSFTPAAIFAAPAATRAELSRLANFAEQQSGGAMRPTRLVTSIRIRQALMETQNSAASDTSVGQYWLNSQENINSITGIAEMEGIGANGEDGLWFYSDDMDSAHFVMVQPPTALPMHAVNALQQQVLYYTSIGGMVMLDVGNNLLAEAVGA